MKWILFSLALALCVAELIAVECYTCAYVPNVPESMSCMDPFNATSQLVTSCDGECSKTSVSLNGDLQGLARTCTLACTEACVSAGGIDSCNYCCSGDKCNGAAAMTFGLATVGLATLIGWAVTKW